MSMSHWRPASGGGWRQSGWAARVSARITNWRAWRSSGTNWTLAVEHYGKAWRMIPERRYVLVDLGRTWKRLNRPEQANAALLAASRERGPGRRECAGTAAGEISLCVGVPAALALDTANIGLRRELAYLLLRMNRQTEAEEEFRSHHAAGREGSAVGGATRLSVPRARRPPERRACCSTACFTVMMKNWRTGSGP